MNSLFSLLARIAKNRRLIKSMAIQEIQRRYAGTVAGFFWMIINPLAILLVFWFIFSVGFKVAARHDVPFVALFFCAYIPWLTFSESMMASASCIVASPHLVKKIAFPTEILVIVNLAASMISHACMLVILLIVLYLNGITPTFYSLTFVYYLFGLLVLSTGIGWLLASVNVFFRDTSQIVGVLVNIWFWMTPIVWFIDMLPPEYQFIVKLNPIYYITEGYRMAFIYGAPCCGPFKWVLFFWVTAIITFAIGGLVFKKLKPEFADVL